MVIGLCIIMAVLEAPDATALQAVLDKGVPPLPSGVRVVWEREEHAGVSAEDIARLSQVVAGKPDHPDRGRLEPARRRLISGPDRTRCEVITDRDGRFRYREIGPGEARLDVTIADGVIWLLSNDSLTLLRSDVPPPPGRNFAPHKASAQRLVAQFGLGALSLIIGLPETRIVRMEEKGSGWTAFVGVKGDMGEFRIEGVIEQGIHQCRLARLVRFTGASDEVGMTAISGEPWVDSPMGTVDRLCEEYGPGQVLRFRHRLLDISPWDDARVFAPPDRDAENEPLRGAMVIRHVTDFRNAAAGEFWSRGAAGEPWQASGLSPQDPARVVRSLDRIGYFALAGVTMVCAGAWLWKRSRRSPAQRRTA